MKLISKNKEILFLFLAALTLRFFLVLTACGIADDGVGYAWLAEEVTKGNFHKAFGAVFPPLFPIFTAGASYIFQDIEFSGRIISCLFGSLTVFPLFFLVKNIFDRKIALVTVLFFVVHPYLSQASGEVLTEAIYYFFLTSIACLCWIAIQKRRKALFLVVGLLLLLAFLTRFEGFVLIFLVLAWIWLIKLPEIRTGIRWRLISSFFCLIVFVVGLLPCLFFVYQETGRWQICNQQQHYEDIFLKSKFDDQSSLQKTGRILKSNIPHSVSQIPFFLAKAYYPVFLLPLGFGLIGRKRLKGFKLGELFILSFILFRISVLLVVAGINARYLYAFIPMALCWAGTGFWEIDYRLQEKFKNKSLTIGEAKISHFSIIILVVIIVICLPRGLKPIRGHRAIQKEAGYWLKAYAGAGQEKIIVVSPSPQEAFYAKAKWYDLEGSTYTEIINNATLKEADFIIIDRNIDKMCPDFRGSIRSDDLELLTDKFEKSKRKIIIYKLKKQ